MIILQIFTLLQSVLGGQQLTQIDIGCLINQQSPCSKLCNLGVEDCSSTLPKCEYGYFLFSLGATTKKPAQCVQCPYYSINYRSDLVNYCMDCYEDPYGWEFTRLCTYDYEVGNGVINTGAYQKKTRTYPELFFVGSSTTGGTWTGIPRVVQFTYATYICSGCASFCTDYQTNSDCNKMDHDYIKVDIDKVAVTCVSGYYFKENVCQSCPYKYCLSCTDDQCNQCESSYRLNSDGKSCIKCANNCSECKTIDDKQICSACDSGYIISLDLLSCESCSDGCLRCEYVSYSTDVDVKYPTRTFTQIDSSLKSSYIKQCRQCSEYGDNFEYYGESCVPCFISNCQLCYYFINNDNDPKTRTSMDLDFIPYGQRNGDTFVDLLCFQCQMGYTLTVDKKSCGPDDSGKKQPNCQRHKLVGSVYKCILCEATFVLDQTTGNCFGKCSSQIEHCSYCFSYDSPDVVEYYDSSGNKKQGAEQKLYQCTKCEDGFYPDFFSSKCLECQTNCDTCSQYNTNYNFTDYIQQQIIESELTKSNYLISEIEDPFCSYCSDGYQLYNNQCQGCTANCVADNSAKTVTDPSTYLTNKCEFQTNGAFCGECFNSSRDRSLTLDLSECHQCPYMCKACRERTQSELERVNLYFNPSNSILAKYSRICYLYDSNTKTGNAITFDTYLNMPVSCTFAAGSTQKCKNTAKIDVKLYCQQEYYQSDYKTANAASQKYMFDLQYFYQVTSTSQTTTNITFSSLEDLATFITFNENAYTELEFQINLISNDVTDGITSCPFKQSTNLIFSFQKNVFSLKVFKVHIIGEPDQSKPPMKLVIDGVLNIPQANYIILEGIEIQAKDIFTEKPYIGLNISDNALTKLELNRFKITKNTDPTSPSKILFQIDNINYMVWNQVQFSSFNSDDIISINYPQNYINSIDYTLNNVLFDQCYFLSKTLFLTNSNTKIQSISIKIGPDGLKFNKCFLENTKIFGETDLTQQNSGEIIASKVVFTFTKFTNSNFINYKTQNTTQLSNIDIIKCNFTNSSIFIKSNSFVIENLYIWKNYIFSDCRLFQSSYKVIDDSYASQAIRLFQFSNLNINDNICFSIGCFFYLSTPINQYSYLSNITFNKILIDSTNSMVITEKESNSVLSALIIITTAQKVQFRNFQALNNLGVSQLAVKDIQSFILIDGVYDWTKQSYVDGVLQPANNLIPTSKSCATRKIEFKSYNEHFLYIADFDIGVQIENVVLRRLLSIDTIFIQIKSWDVEEYNSTSDTQIIENTMFYNGTYKEVIVLRNIKVESNSLVITESRSAISSIYIVSSQEQDIVIDSSEFYDNHLHSLSTDQLSPSSPIIMINSPLSVIYLVNCLFKENRATQVHFSLIYIVSYNITIEQCSFENTNIRKQDWVYRLEEQQMLTSDSTSDQIQTITTVLEQFFPIICVGGNFHIKTAVLHIDQSTFNTAQALQGAGMYIETIESGIITISQSRFLNQYNSLLNQYSSKGGCLYIDSANSGIDLTITSVVMDNCVTRTEGGCIYLNPSTQQSQVSIADSTFSNCQGIQSSVFSFQFSSSSPTLPMVSISNCLIYSNNIANFLRNIPDITTTDLVYFVATSTALYQVYGRLVIDSTIFRYFSFISVLYLEEMVEVQMNDVQINTNTILINSILKISLASASGTITLTSSQFNDHVQFNVVSTTDQDCSKYTVSTNTDNLLTEQTCLQVENLDDTYRTDDLPFILYSQGQDNSFPLYFPDIETNYKAKTDSDKYNIDPPVFDVIISFHNPSITLTIDFTNYIVFDDLSNQDFTNCFFSNLINDYLLTPSSGIIQIQSVTKTQYLTLESISIGNNKCLRCTKGLIQVYHVHQETYPLIDITDLNCFLNYAGYYGCIVLTHDETLSEIDQTLPLTDYSLTSSRILTVTDDLLKQNNVLMIKQSSFLNNVAKVGAGVSIIGLESLIIQSQFCDNYASLLGGALYYQSVTYNNAITNLHISENTFQGNKAQLAGGMFISGGSIGNITAIEISFQNNQGQIRGDNLEEYPQSLTITMQDGSLLNKKTYNSTSNGDLDNDGFIDSAKIEIIDIINLDPYSIFNYQNETTYLLLPSGQAINSYKYYFADTDEQVPYNWKFRIVNLDRFKQPMSNIQKTETCAITGRIMDSNNYNESKEYLSNFTNIQSFSYDPAEGVFNLDSLIVTFDPYLEDNLFLQLKFVCTSIKIPVYSTTSPYTIQTYNTNYALLVNVKTIPCQLGEAYTLQQCKACTKADKTYSVTEKQAQCQVMDSSTMDDVSPTGIKLSAGYWRPLFDSEKITYCLNLPLSCNGGWTPGNPSCYTGHMGGLCESCDIYGVRDDRQAISAKYKCGPCADTQAVNAIVITALSLVTLVSMTLSVKGNYQMLEDFVKTQNRIQMGILVSPNQSNLAILIKLFTNYFQILSAISTFQINLSEGITNATQVLGNPTQSMSYSLDCFLVDMTTIEILYFRLIWALLMPLIYLAVFLFGYAISVYVKYVEFKEGIIYTAFIYMFLYLQPTLVGGFISLASSRELGGISWVQADVLYQYDTSTHYLWLAGFVTPLLLCWAFLFPCIFMFLVYNVRKRLSDFEVRKKLGYFYNEYTQEGYLWEFVKIFEKELIIIFLTFYEDRVVVKGLIIFLIVFFYGGFTLKYHPYQSNRLNFIDRLSTAICAASLCLGVLIYASIVQDLIYLEIIMLIIVALLNIAFIILMIYYLFEGYLIKFQPQLDKIRDQLRIHHPEIQEKYPWTRKMLFNQAKMNERVKKLWAILRYQTRKGIQRKREDPHAPLFVNENIDQPILLPFFEQVSKDTKEQKSNNQQDSPNFNKVYPEKEPLNSDGISLDQFQSN